MSIVDNVLSNNLATLHGGSTPALPSMPVPPQSQMGAPSFVAPTGPVEIQSVSSTPLPDSPMPSVGSFNPGTLAPKLACSVQQMLLGSFPGVPSSMVLPDPPTVPPGLIPSVSRKLDSLAPEVKQAVIEKANRDAELKARGIPELLGVTVDLSTYPPLTPTEQAEKEKIVAGNIDTQLASLPAPPWVPSISPLGPAPALPNVKTEPLTEKFSFPTVCDPGISCFIRAALHTMTGVFTDFWEAISSFYTPDVRKMPTAAMNISSYLGAYPFVKPPLIAKQFLDDVKIPDLVKATKENMEAAKTYVNTQIESAQTEIKRQSEALKAAKDKATRAAEYGLSVTAQKSQEEAAAAEAEIKKQTELASAAVASQTTEINKRVEQSVAWAKPWMEQYFKLMQFFVGLPALAIKAMIDWLKEALKDPIALISAIPSGLKGMVDTVKKVITDASGSLLTSLGLDAKTPSSTEPGIPPIPPIPPMVSVMYATLTEAMNIIQSFPFSIPPLASELAQTPCSSTAPIAT